MLLSFIVCNIVSATENNIDLTKTPPPPPIPMVLVLTLPVSTTINETQLAIYYESQIGENTVSVIDASSSMSTRK